MAWFTLGRDLPRASEAPGELRELKRLHRRANRRAAKAEIVLQLQDDAEATLQTEDEEWMDMLYLDYLCSLDYLDDVA